MSWMLLLALTAAVDVNVRTLSGQSIDGTLTSIDNQAVVINTKEGAKTVKLVDLRTITTGQETSHDPESGTELTLRNGSRIPIRHYVQQQGEATVVHALLGKWKIPGRSIAHVLFQHQPEGSEFAKQWGALIADKRTGDMVVFRRDEALDHLVGVIHAVGEEKLDFGFEGDRISPRRARLEGLAFFHPPVGTPPTTRIQIVDRLGGLWQVSDIKLDGNVVVLTTPSGVSARLPVKAIVKFDFGSSNISYLSDLKMEKSTWRPYLQFGPVSPLQQDHFGPKRDRTLNGGPLTLNGQVYKKGLALHSHTEISYRLQEDYQSFRALAGLDRANIGKVGGQAELIVRADGDRELFRCDLSIDAPPVLIEIKLEEVRRLTIIVDFGDENDIGDHVLLCEARLTK